MTKIWTARSSAATNLFYDMDINLKTGRIVAIGDNTTTAKVLTSDDGVSWSLLTPGIVRYWRGICYSIDLDLWVAVGWHWYSSGTGPIFYWYVAKIAISSDDGNTWTDVSSGAVLNNAVGLYSILWCRELSIFVGVGYSYKSYTSPNGTDWTSHSMPTLLDLRDVAWSPSLGLFIAVGVYSSKPYIALSTNGSSWVHVPLQFSFNAEFTGVVWSTLLKTFFINGHNTSTGEWVIAKSTDGTNWTVIDTTAPYHLNSGRIIEINNVLFACGHDPIAVGLTYPNLMTSVDGVNWYPMYNPNIIKTGDSSGVSSLRFNGNMLIGISTGDSIFNSLRRV